MELKQRLALSKGPMPIILIAAVVQGWALYALHQSIKQEFWPATDTAWLLGLYSLTLFVPLTIQLLSEHAKSKSLWFVVAALAFAYFYFGHHHGANIVPVTVKQIIDADEFVPTAFIMGLLWLLLIPFVQVRLATGEFQYAALFMTAWRNKLLLAEAGLFTGLFWLLLVLWAVLFNMLGIAYFKELFEEPIFFYPVTTIVFGVALHLVGSVERLTAAILEQLLNVLKWLAIVAGLILTLFTIALIFKLPGLVFEGQKAIGAAWLLWLVAVIVLLINAAYRDGTVTQPYPAWLAFALRCVIPLTVIISATALYALFVRARNYGITVERVWAFIVAGTALAYSLGYSIAAIGKGKWLEGIARVNVTVAVALIATISLTLTPILSPYRLAANSQYRVALAATGSADKKDQSSPYRYLRFDSGQYGRKRLNELSTLQNHPDAPRVRAVATRAIAVANTAQQIGLDTDEIINNLVLFPAKHELDADLRRYLTDTIGEWGGSINRSGAEDESSVAGIFIDLNADSVDEFVLLHHYGGTVVQRSTAGWKRAGGVFPSHKDGKSLKAQLESVAKGDVSAKPQEWRVLKVGDTEFTLSPTR